jgi:hypothetical protein
MWWLANGRIWRRLQMPIDKPYAYHRPSSEALRKITELRKAFSHIDRLIKESTPFGRQQSIAITKNEEAAMWAIKAVVFNDPDSTPEFSSVDDIPGEGDK